LNVKVEELSDDNLDQFYAIIVRTAERKGFSVHPLTYFQDLKRNFGKSAKFMLAYLDCPAYLAYLDENIKSSWVKDGNYWFYMDDNSELAENQWIYIGGKWYFAKAGGYIAENEWLSYKGKWYYAVSGGAIAQSAWENIGGKFYHFGADGDLSVNTSVDGYQVDANGVRN